MNERREAIERQLDWGLTEVVGQSRAPDLSAQILARHLGQQQLPPGFAVDEVGKPPELVRSSRERVNAALLFFGLALVIGVVVLSPATPDGVSATRFEPIEPAYAHSVEDIRALPANTLAVRIEGATDTMLLAAAEHLRQLEQLEVHYGWRLSHGMMLKLAAPDVVPSITDAGLEHIAALAKLRSLDLAGPVSVHGAGLVHLARLPMLQVLRLRYMDTADEHLTVLAEFEALETLDLSFNHGFVTVDPVLRCPGLRELSLEGCQQLHGTELARLSALQQLETLNVGKLDRINWAWGESREQPAIDLVARNRRLAKGSGTGLSDVALRGIAEAPRLRELSIANGGYSASGLAALADCHTLEVLDAFGCNAPDNFVRWLPPSLRKLRICGEQGDAFCRQAIDTLPALTDLDVGACDQISDVGIRALLEAPRITRLSLRQCYGTTQALLADLKRAKHLRHLDLRHVKWLTPEDGQTLRRDLPDAEVLTDHPR